MRRSFAPILLLVLVLGLNANALRAFFVGDDFEILYKVTQLDDLADALHMTYVDNWGPLSYVQFYLNYRLAGLDPLIYHLTNLGWLGLLVVALYSFVRRALPAEPWAAWAAALLFLTHPAHDQAVTNICGRSHVIATAMAVVALGLYARSRLGSEGRAGRLLLLAGALVAGFLGGLSKETAMTLPAWIAAFEWLFCRRQGSFVKSGLRASGVALLFVVAALAVFVVGVLVVGHPSPKVEGDSLNTEDFSTSDLAAYALIGGLPFPFAWVDLSMLERVQLLGWLALAAVVVTGAVCFWRASFGPRPTKASALFVLGLTIAATPMLPIAYADLQLQRRYVFISDVGTVLMAVAVFLALRTRLPRASRVVLALMVVAGAVATVQRNDLYVRSGAVVRSLIETVFETPIEQLPLALGAEARYVALTTLPRYYGGDRASGAITLHSTDMRAAIKLFGSAKPEVAYALRCYHAEDYSARVEKVDEFTLDLTVSFRSQLAFAEALARDPDDAGFGDAVEAGSSSSEPDSRILRYRLSLDPDFRAESGELFAYSDGRFTRVGP